MGTDTTPTVKALRTLELLQLCGQVSAAELARDLGVTERAARRCVATLRQAGIPVESTRGPWGGYRLGRGARLPPLLFSAAEALGLVMAVLESERDPATDDVVGTAVGKLVGALPRSVAAQAEALHRHARSSAEDPVPRPDPGRLSALVAAVADDRRVEIFYRSQAGNAWTGVVDPWAVVVRHGRWYLLCHSHHADDVRTYRVDRIRGVTTLPDTFVRPADLDPVAQLERNLGQGWAHPTRVRIDAPAAAVRPWLPRHLGVLQPDGDEACLLIGSTSNPQAYLEAFCCLPHRFVIEGGDELRDAAADLAARLGAAVGG